MPSSTLPLFTSRNYLVPMPEGQIGQRHDQQINNLDEFTAALDTEQQLYLVQNGYVKSSPDQLQRCVLEYCGRILDPHGKAALSFAPLTIHLSEPRLKKIMENADQRLHAEQQCSLADLIKIGVQYDAEVGLLYLFSFCPPGGQSISSSTSQHC